MYLFNNNDFSFSFLGKNNILSVNFFLWTEARIKMQKNQIDFRSEENRSPR